MYQLCKTHVECSVVRSSLASTRKYRSCTDRAPDIWSRTVVARNGVPSILDHSGTCPARSDHDRHNPSYIKLYTKSTRILVKGNILNTYVESNRDLSNVGCRYIWQLPSHKPHVRSKMVDTCVLARRWRCSWHLSSPLYSNIDRWRRRRARSRWGLCNLPLRNFLLQERTWLSVHQWILKKKSR